MTDVILSARQLTYQAQGRALVFGDGDIDPVLSQELVAAPAQQAKQKVVDELDPARGVEDEGAQIDARQEVAEAGIGSTDMLLGHDPSSGPVQDLRARWEAIVDDEVGRDVELRGEMIRNFKERRHWPAGLFRSMAASYELDAATWSAVADLLEAAHERSASTVG